MEGREKDPEQKHDTEKQGLKGNGSDRMAEVVGKDSKRVRVTEVKFRSRKRSKKVRRRKLDIEATEKDEGGESEELQMSELLLIKEAQKLREQSRQSALDISAVGRGTDQVASSKRSDVADDDIASGLQSNFAVERSSHAVEERMDKYVEERMRERFGNRYEEDGQTGNQVKNLEETDLFAIPDRLQVKERPLYDPGEGMPAAGVEEVELSEEARQQNIEKTVQAHKELLATRGMREKENNTEMLPGNVSANFAKHKTDWIADHLGSSSIELQERGGSSVIPESAAPRAKGREKDAHGERTRRKYQPATDGLIADRFRKRWRR